MLRMGRQSRLLKVGLSASWIFAILFLVSLFFTLPSRAVELPQTPDRSQSLEPLFLEVMINEQPTNLIASFFRSPDGKIGTSPAELADIGVKVPEEAGSQEIVYLSDIPSLRFEYDEISQLLKINIVDGQRLAKEYNTSDNQAKHQLTPSGIGAVANYSLFATSSLETGGEFGVENVSASLDGWIYGPMGKIYGSGIVSTHGFDEFEFLRLDTSWVYSESKSANIYTIGDAITGGLSWTRPLRLGGFQLQKNFSLRPDLITTPLFKASGSAAVPSTVDVYIGNLKAHTQDVEAGPFTINQVPSVSGVGNARIVVTDATGREQETTKPFYISSNLLRQGLLDYSFEAGFARLNYGSISNNYSEDFSGSGTFRYGVSDKFTLEGHAEGNSSLINGGVGASFTIANRALLSLAGSASKTAEATGYQIYGAFDTQFMGMNIHASSRRSFGDYQDMASITAPEIIDTGATGPAYTGTGIAKAFDQVSIGIPLPKVKGGLNLSFAHLENVVDEASDIASISYSQKVFGKASLSLSVYSELDNLSKSGVYVSLSMPIGEKIYSSASVERSDGKFKFNARASKSAEPEPGSWGWNISDSEGSKSSRSAGVTYQGKRTYSQVNVHQDSEGARADGFIDGAVVIADSGIYFANRIADAFAVVDAGEADIPVYLANHLVGQTNKHGKLLVPGLLSYEENNIRIDAENLPVNASLSGTEQVITPADGAGVNVNFNVQIQTQNAIVIFTDSEGKFLEVGDEGKLSASASQFVIGYDGRAFIEELSGSNLVTISTASGNCNASFDFAAIADDQIEIGPVVCQ